MARTSHTVGIPAMTSMQDFTVCVIVAVLILHEVFLWGIKCFPEIAPRHSSWRRTTARYLVFMSESQLKQTETFSSNMYFFFFFFFFDCVGFYIRLLPWAECLPVFVSGSGVKMAAAPVWAPLLPIQPQPKVWNRLHLILNTWQQLERRKGERRKKFFFFKKEKRKEKRSGFVNELPPTLPLSVLP